jgi:hypothetical protein
MAVVTAATTIERLAPAGVRVARAIGAVAVVVGVFLLVRATRSGERLARASRAVRAAGRPSSLDGYRSAPHLPHDIYRNPPLLESP